MLSKSKINWTMGRVIISLVAICTIITVGCVLSQTKSRDMFRADIIEKINSKLDKYHLEFIESEERYKIYIQDFKLSKTEDGRDLVESLIYFGNIQKNIQTKSYNVSIPLVEDEENNGNIAKRLNNSIDLDKIIPYIFSKYVFLRNVKNESAVLKDIKNVHFLRDSQDRCYLANVLGEDADFHEKVVIEGHDAVTFNAKYIYEKDKKIFRVKDIKTFHNVKPLWYVHKESVQEIKIFKDQELQKTVSNKKYIQTVFKMIGEYEFEDLDSKIKETRNKKYKYRMEFEDDKHHYRIYIDEEKIIIENENRISVNDVSEEFQFFIDVFEM